MISGIVTLYFLRNKHCLETWLRVLSVSGAPFSLTQWAKGHCTLCWSLQCTQKHRQECLFGKKSQPYISQWPYRPTRLRKCKKNYTFWPRFWFPEIPAKICSICCQNSPRIRLTDSFLNLECLTFIVHDRAHCLACKHSGPDVQRGFWEHLALSGPVVLDAVLPGPETHVITWRPPCGWSPGGSEKQDGGCDWHVNSLSACSNGK